MWSVIKVRFDPKFGRFNERVNIGAASRGKRAFFRVSPRFISVKALSALSNHEYVITGTALCARYAISPDPSFAEFKYLMTPRCGSESRNLLKPENLHCQLRTEDCIHKFRICSRRFSTHTPAPFINKYLRFHLRPPIPNPIYILTFNHPLCIITPALFIFKLDTEWN